MDEAVKRALETKGRDFVNELVEQGADWKTWMRWFRRTFFELAVRNAKNNKAQACRRHGIALSTPDMQAVRTRKVLEEVAAQ